MAFDHEWQSCAGTITSDNRDYCGVAERPDATLYVVIDGATRGPQGDDLAKGIAHHLVDQFFESDDPINTAQIANILQSAHEELRRTFPADSASYFVLINTESGQIITAHAGDCRLGCVTPDNSIEWLSKVHTLANSIEDLSDAALMVNPDRHILTRSFRAGRLPDPEFGEYQASSAKTLLIATDGFWADLNSEEQMEYLEGKLTSSKKETDDRSCLILRNYESPAHKAQPDEARMPDNFYFRSLMGK